MNIWRPNLAANNIKAKITALLARANDPGATEEERRTSASLAAKLMSEHGFAPQASPKPPVPPLRRPQRKHRTRCNSSSKDFSAGTPQRARSNERQRPPSASEPRCSMSSRCSGTGSGNWLPGRSQIRAHTVFKTDDRAVQAVDNVRLLVPYVEPKAVEPAQIRDLRRCCLAERDHSRVLR